MLFPRGAAACVLVHALLSRCFFLHRVLTIYLYFMDLISDYQVARSNTCGLTLNRSHASRHVSRHASRHASRHMRLPFAASTRLHTRSPRLPLGSLVALSSAKRFTFGPPRDRRAICCTRTQVTMLYFHTGALSFGYLSLCLLVSQFGVVWMRVLPYLHVTYGKDSLFCKRASDRDPALPHAAQATAHAARSHPCVAVL